MAPEDRKRALIETALGLFASRPYEAVSVDDLARAAGMSRPLLYHYYGSKYGVFLAALQTCADRLTSAVDRAHRSTPDDWLAAGLRAYLHHIREDALGYTTLLGHGSGTATSEEEAILDSAREGILVSLLESMRMPQVCEAGDTTAVPDLLRSVVRGWIGLVEMIGRDWLRTQEPGRDQLVALLRELFGSSVLTAARYDAHVTRCLRQARGLEGAGIELPAGTYVLSVAPE
ncbi:TetR/AcrR family transcriptional regulator [Streptomyces sp. RB6PN25]|uniref:TetR/AcrR family transcriptional regulator n=1 Tax=Streptomyces humicola TaxID=2953240 RepID=A0ABT1Q493_9ACTN|nr:TetR/AcrR family transcriptional regulator [Streptomyces humicola]MCQ4084749.1 TetR/AcrR family transcriptional regulator [Streptomyces humicola]